MVGLIVIIWFLLVVAIPLGLIVTAYVAFVRDRNLLFVVPTFVGALFVYVLVTVWMLEPMFIIVYAGAHSDPNGQGMDIWAILLLLTLDFGFAIFGWLAFSAVNGGFIKLWKPFLRPTIKNGND